MKNIDELEYEVERLEREGKITEEASRNLRWHSESYDDFEIENQLRREGVSYSDIDRVLGR